MKSSKEKARASWKGSGDKSVEEKWFKVKRRIKSDRIFRLSNLIKLKEWS